MFHDESARKETRNSLAEMKLKFSCKQADNDDDRKWWAEKAYKLVISEVQSIDESSTERRRPRQLI